MRHVDVRQTDFEVLPDEELVRRSLGHDEGAIRVLTTRYNQRLYRIARGIVRNEDEAEDIVQAAYVRAFTTLDRFRGDAGFGTWLTRIAINEALGRMRTRRTTLPWDEAGEVRLHGRTLPFPGAATPRDPEHTMADKELRTLIERAIDDLPDAFRIVFVAREVEGLSIEETARTFGLRPQTVKTRVYRARRRLRARLTQMIGPAISDAFSFDGIRCQRMTDAVVARLAWKVGEPSRTSSI